jgi:hypothetical protein
MMAKLTMVVGVLLVLISVGFWVVMGRTEMAALHPAGVGILLIICGALANTEDPKKRMLWMHLAVTLGLIGFLTTGIRAAISAAKGITVMAAFEERVAIALVCLVYVGLCVRSFIAARKARTV